jgi:hypothetical protein
MMLAGKFFVDEGKTSSSTIDQCVGLNLVITIGEGTRNYEMISIH